MPMNRGVENVQGIGNDEPEIGDAPERSGPRCAAMNQFQTLCRPNWAGQDLNAAGLGRGHGLEL